MYSTLVVVISQSPGFIKPGLLGSLINGQTGTALLPAVWSLKAGTFVIFRRKGILWYVRGKPCHVAKSLTYRVCESGFITAGPNKIPQINIPRDTQYNRWPNFYTRHLINTLIQLIVAKRRHKATRSWVNIGSRNGLLPNGTKPLPEPMLTYHQQGPVVFIGGHYHEIWRCQSVKQDWKLHFYNHI